MILPVAQRSVSVMTAKATEDNIKRINDYLSKCKWMDFDFVNIGCDRIKIIGSMDLSWENYHSIEIEFESSEYISALLWGFSLRKDRPFIELESKDTVLNDLGLSLAQDDHCFKINVEDFDKLPVKIIAKNIRFIVLKQPDEGL